MKTPTANDLPALSPAECHELLRLARTAIGSILGLSEPPVLQLDTPALLAPGGAFVTVHTAGELRGCVGSILPRNPLHSVVVAMARAAAFDDPRFDPIQRQDWPALRIEISRLGALRPAPPESVEPGRHGLYIVRGSTRGLLLPQVAIREGWDSIRFLRETCRKAGLPADSWQTPDTEIFVFEAEVFSEPD